MKGKKVWSPKDCSYKFLIELLLYSGDVPVENSLLRQVSSLLRRLPAIESEKFQDDFLMEYNDTLLISYLAMFTNCSSTMNELVDKFNTAYDRQSRRGGRSAFI
ncbi:COP9 signalosome complex subunit 6a-like [Olea europaea subsp. europaea]|uniref:COP9 signalosome complex subunit 6a-like n=1 Tax=Olea europaea subsp. europaea TaxID=158383 RepID=A0A8S0R793_OLEEU|nr:COP9 signalosome complex subunit 6a-like [Olea europaea subsp. europaea]